MIRPRRRNCFARQSLGEGRRRAVIRGWHVIDSFRFCLRVCNCLCRKRSGVNHGLNLCLHWQCGSLDLCPCPENCLRSTVWRWGLLCSRKRGSSSASCFGMCNFNVISFYNFL